MNYETASDFEINKAVAVKRGLKLGKSQCASLKVHSSSVIAQSWLTGRFLEFNFLKDPADAWPVILANEIDIQFRQGTKCAPIAKHLNEYAVDKNPLKAAMICFLKMKEV